MPGDLSHGKSGGLFVLNNAKVDARLYMMTRLNSRNTWDPLEEKSSSVALGPINLHTLFNVTTRFKFECEGKRRTNAKSTLKLDLAIKLRYNLICDHKIQSQLLNHIFLKLIEIF